ncbi:serine hydrolase [Novosphingobium sp.]|uniref:serine hydrolase domain-containing protein n=1 Tax=Novosphingobium sp. TaxID=1874826 RepID=UPI0025E3E11E|nr:serine hydrolase [Novosphingobium sp.]
MGSRRLPLILPLALLPALLGCSGDNAAPALPPLTSAALSAVVDKPGVNRDALARSVDRLFAAPDTSETRAVVVMRDGHIVAERYAPGYHENTRFISWSMAKSVTGVMIGMLVSDGRLRLDETAPVPAWQRPGDPRGEITLRQLLQMRSGLRHVEAEGAPYLTDTARMLFMDGRDDTAAYAEAQPLEAEPGAKWEYSTATSIILSDLAARSLTTSTDPAERRRVVHDYLQTRMFEPIGMKSMIAEFDAAGTLLGGSLMHGTARDWARFGEFLRNRGAVKGAQLVPTTWIDFMTRPSPRNQGYGAQIWLNRPQAGDGHLEWPGAPASTFSMNGHLGQFVAVAPTKGVVVVRLGKTAEGAHAPVRSAMAQIIQLFPQTAAPQKDPAK